MSSAPKFSSLQQELRQYFFTGATRPLSWRRRQLRGVLNMIREHEAAFVQALQADLRKCQTESVITELVIVQREAEDLLKHLDQWTRPEPVATPGVLLPASSEVRRDPHGVCLIVGPFNYPVQLLLASLLGALAAGNCAVVKPSEQCPASEQLLVDLLPRYVDSKAVRVVTGAIPEMQALLALEWDMIFFTGSERVGKIIMEAASKFLTPVVLELGGKSPAIVDASVRDLELAARRLTWGKFTNCGQTCIAPDYILCHRAVYDRFLELLVRMVNDFYGSDAKDAPDFGRIVNERQAERLANMLKDDPGRILVGGEVDVANRYIAPTVIADCRLDSAVMQEEIFGPLMPVIPYENLDEAVSIIHRKPKPLALYIFATDDRVKNTLMDRVQSGGVCINDALVHVLNCDLPFGGVGTSGMGSYHGKFSINAFSHTRAVLRKDDRSIFDVPIRYPPYTAFGENMFRKLAVALPAIPPITVGGVLKFLLFAAIVIFIALGVQRKAIEFHFDRF